jgi:uncharacterized membrane protein
MCLAAFWLPAQFDWLTSLRLALAGMFLLTASAHWGERRQDLIAMVPPAFPRPDLLVTVTGVLEIIGAVGLMLSIAAPYAALGLCFMLMAVFPANFHAARQHLSIAGRRQSKLCFHARFCSSCFSLRQPLSSRQENVDEAFGPTAINVQRGRVQTPETRSTNCCRRRRSGLEQPDRATPGTHPARIEH